MINKRFIPYESHGIQVGSGNSTKLDDTGGRTQYQSSHVSTFDDVNDANYGELHEGRCSVRQSHEKRTHQPFDCGT